MSYVGVVNVKYRIVGNTQVGVRVHIDTHKMMLQVWRKEEY